jgi:hypothetical protein
MRQKVIFWIARTLIGYAARMIANELRRGEEKDAADETQEP